MKYRIEDIAGKKFNHLTVVGKEIISVRRVSGGKADRFIKCVCKCGSKSFVRVNELVTGGKKSCGCWKSEATSIKNHKHGLRRSPLYSLWLSMRGRCYTKTNKDYKDYGGRGISVCKEWDSFDKFHAWAKDKHKKGYLLDRIDVDGNYAPDNCRFADKIESANNKRNTVRHDFNGEMLTYSEAARKYNINRRYLNEKVLKGVAPTTALIDMGVTF